MSDKKIQLKIVTPERTVLEAEIDQATLPVLGGEVTILPDHCSYIAALKAGEIMLKTKGEEKLLATSGGFIEFQNNTLTVLADTAEHAEEIDVARAEQARKRAEQLETQDMQATAMIEKETARIKVGHKHHTKHGIKID